MSRTNFTCRRARRALLLALALAPGLSLAGAAGAATLRSSTCQNLNATDTSVPAATSAGVTVRLGADPPPAADRTRREHVRISQQVATDLAIAGASATGESPQVRVALTAFDTTSTANFTVAAIVADGTARWVEVHRPEAAGDPDRDSGFFKLFGTATVAAVEAQTVTATLYRTAPGRTLIVGADGAVTDQVHFDEPNDGSNFFRECVEVRDDNRLVVVTPHGGGIETGLSARLPAFLTALDTTYGIRASAWEAVGQWSLAGGQTFPRWHVTATQIEDGSFPGFDRLDTISPRFQSDTPFQYALALHGFDHDEEPAIVVGGAANRNLKCFLVSTIETLLAARGLNMDGRITYRIYAPGSAPLDIVREPQFPGDAPDALTEAEVGDLAGFDADNIVNRLSPFATRGADRGGVQLELSSALRADAGLLGTFLSRLARAFDQYVATQPTLDYCARLD